MILRHAMRGMLVPAALVLAGTCVNACGHAGDGAFSGSSVQTVGATLPQPAIYRDPDYDSDSYPGERDEDNPSENKTSLFGRAANVAESRAIATLVKRYYAAAAARDGVGACRLMYATFAESVAEDYGNPNAGSGSESCARTASRLFASLGSSLRAESATLRVVAARVRNRVAAVVLRFGGQPGVRYFELRLERGAWKVNRLMAAERPIYLE
jgi:hypothetical protein